MSSFSSVVRKPGQKIVPKAAPRRNVQRRVQGPAAPATGTLTPDGTTQDDASQDASPAQDLRDGAQNASVDAGPAPTPPPTSPAQSGSDNQATLTRIGTPDPEPRVGIISPNRRRESTVPVVATSEPSPNTRQTRRAEVADGVATVQNTTAVNGIRQTVHGPPPAKRRRVALPETVSAVVVPSTAPSAVQARARRPSATQSQANTIIGTDADLQNVSSQFRAISELANSIETRTRTSRSRTGQRSTAETDSDYETTEVQSLRERSAASRSAAIEDAAAAVVARAVRGNKRGRARHRRGHTPEDAENHRIDATQTSMADLVVDSGLGQRSQTGRRLEAEWDDIKARWDQRLLTNRANAKNKTTQRRAARPKAVAGHEGEGDEVAEVNNHALGVPAQTFHIVNGSIAVADDARLVEFSRNAVDAAVNVDESLIQSDETIYNYVNQNRIGKHAGLRNVTKWTDELNDKFYQGLRVFGTDFELISSLFGEGWTRRQIKAKFVREERQNLLKVKAALAEREQVDLNGYVKMTDGGLETFRDPKEIEAELEAEEKKIRDEWEKSKRGDHFAEDEADQPLESIETDHLADGATGRASATPGVEPNRFSALAERVVRKAAQPRKKQPQKQREQTGTSRTSNAGRRATRGKKPLEGVEERIGNVGDVEL